MEEGMNELPLLLFAALRLLTVWGEWANKLHQGKIAETAI